MAASTRPWIRTASVDQRRFPARPPHGISPCTEIIVPTFRAASGNDRSPASGSPQCPWRYTITSPVSAAAGNA
jgi:hypothetical protein